MKKKLLMLVMCVVLTIGLTACGSTYDGAFEGSKSSGNYAPGFESDTSFEDYNNDNKGSDINDVQSGEYSQKLILRYSREYQSKDFDKSYAYVENKVKEFGGYIESSNIYGYIDRTANLVLRIPVSRAEEFLKEDGELGTRVSNSQSAEDITLQYYDVKAHIETLETKRARLLELLKEAKDVADIITIEEQLSDCEYEINSLTSTMKLYDNLVLYTTINLTIYEVRDIEAVGEDSVAQRIGKGFVANFHDVCDRIVDFVIWLITSIPYIVLIALFGLFIFIIFKLLGLIDKKLFKPARDKRKLKKKEKEDKELKNAIKLVEEAAKEEKK